LTEKSLYFSQKKLQFGLKKLISRRWPDVYIFGLTKKKTNENVDSHLFAFGRSSANIKTILKIIASFRTIWRQSCFYYCFYCAVHRVYIRLGTLCINWSPCVCTLENWTKFGAYIFYSTGW